jgi:lysophospholipase L1-like esterase
MKVPRVTLALLLMAAPLAAGRAEETPLPQSWDYARAMRRVAQQGHARTGVVLHVGDSITYANPYSQWAVAGTGRTDDDLDLLHWMHAGANDDRDGWWLCRVDLPGGRSHTACGGMRLDELLAGGRSGLPSLARLLETYKPQLVVLMIGTNDVSAGRPVGAYRADLQRAVDLALGQGVVCVLSTIPPHPGRPDLARSYNEAVRDVAKARELPLIDYEREILKRRPDDWNGTLLEKNDVHPTASQGGTTPVSEPTAENLRNSGYLLRGWLSVRKVGEAKRTVLDPLFPAAVVTRALQGPAAVRDALIDPGRPDRNFGGEARDNALVRGEECGAFLVRFDLARLRVPRRAKLTKAMVTFYVWDPSSQGKTHVAAFALKAPWDDRTVTWHQAAAGKSWQGGKAFVYGTDTAPEARHVVVKPDEGSDTVDPPLEYTIDITDLVRDWLDGKLPNHGLAVAPVADRAVDDGQQTRFQVYGSEHERVQYTPKLTVRFERDTGTGRPGEPEKRPDKAPSPPR